MTDYRKKRYCNVSNPFNIFLLTDNFPISSELVYNKGLKLLKLFFRAFCTLIFYIIFYYNPIHSLV